MSDLWLRKIELVVTPSLGNEGLDLSDLHIRFTINAADFETPGNAYVRVFNLSNQTSKRIMNEFNGVILNAGYQSAQYGQIFKGKLKQIKRGRLNPTDSFLDLYAADYDTWGAFGFINKSLHAPVAPQNVLDAINGTLSPFDVATSTDGLGNITALTRGKAMFGMSKFALRDFAITQQDDWSIQQGRLQLTHKTGYRQGDVVELNSDTGMIGVPEQTQEGIRVRCLLNPRLRIGDLIRLNESEVTQTVMRGFGFPKFSDVMTQIIPPINDSDGLYRVFVIEHQGDNRGTPWWSDLVCLAAPNGHVQF